MVLKISKILFLTLQFHSCIIQQVNSNARFLEPPCRSSIWRIPEFSNLNPPQNYNDNHVDCGGVMVEEDFSDKCGICGDAVTLSKPRPNEDGGIYSKGIIVRTYKPEQEIPVTIQLTYGQKGYIGFSLCGRDDPKSHSEPLCYNEHHLNINGMGKKFLVTEQPGKYYNLTLSLPKNVNCKNCVLRGIYRTGNNWGECGAGKPGALGCGPQTVFIGCSDIAILSN